MNSFSAPLRTIVHATDCSASSRPALAQSLGLARENHARLILLHVVDTLGAEKVTYGEAVSKVQPSSYQRRRLNDFRCWVQGVDGTGNVGLVVETNRPDQGNDVRCWIEFPEITRPVGLFLCEGDPVTAIIRIAESYQADLLVLGSPSRKKWENVLFRSNTEQVLHRACCSVLIVKRVAAKTQLALDPSQKPQLQPGETAPARRGDA